jgi:thioredoxin-related protein
MQKRFNTLLILAMILAISGAAGQSNFRDLTFQEAVSEANQEDKLLFVDAYTDWCGWCKVMDRETFSTEEIGNFMNEKFVSIKVNMEEGFGIDLAMKYRVSSYPHYLIFDETGQLLAKFGGYLEPQPFKEKVTTVLLPENHLPPLENPMDFELGFPDFYRNSFKKRQDRSYPSAEELMAYLNEHTDVTDIATWGVVYRFVNDGPYVEKIIANKDALIDKYGGEDVMAKLSRIVFTEVKAAIKSEDEGAFQASLQSADKLLGEEAEDYKLRYRLYYYQMTSQWKDYADIGNSLAMENLEENAASLNQIAWTLYEKCESSDAVQLAHDWMKDLVESVPEYAYLDTYAAILYNIVKKDEALNAASKAIVITK